MRKGYLLMIGIICLAVGAGIWSYLYMSDSKEVRLLKKANFATADYEVIQPAIHQFGMRFMEAQYEQTQENSIMSPASLFMVLSAVSIGAIDETEEAMHDVLHMKDASRKEIMQGNAALLQALYRDMDDIDIELANSLWLTDKYAFEKQFVKDVEQYFTASVETADLTTDQTMQKVNDWVAKQTNNKVDKIVEENLGDQTIALLLNALYFNGAWEKPFSEEATADEDFTLENGDVKEVAMMYKDDSFFYTESETYQAIRIPYEKGELSMYVYLPREDVPLDDWLADMQDREVEQIKAEMEMGDGELYLPTFRFATDLSLNEYLQANGMERAFDEEDAQFDDMIQSLEKVWLSDVKQKTYIEVNEKGTEAAAVSSSEMEAEYALPPDGEPFVMKVDRPYFFTITDEETNVDLFMGTIADPDE